LMRYLVLNGQRALALRQFEQCRAVLKQTLAIPPMPETLALYHSISDLATHPTSQASMHATAAAAAAVEGASGAAAQLQAARSHLAQADSCLRHSIELIDR